MTFCIQTVIGTEKERALLIIITGIHNRVGETAGYSSEYCEYNCEKKMVKDIIIVSEFRCTTKSKQKTKQQNKTKNNKVKGTL